MGNYPFLLFKIFISMIYKQKVQSLLETLEVKLRIIESVSTGQMKMSNQEVAHLINQTKNIREQLSEIVRLEK
jgi:hypothetical protein